jgi:hypothetical protein
MLKDARLWLQKHWWGLIVSHFLLFGGVYLAIWAIVEPLGVADNFEKPPDFARFRIFYHLILTVIIAAYITLILDLYFRRNFWLGLQPQQKYRNADTLGIQNIHLPGKNKERLADQLERADRIRIMSVNAQLFIRSNKQQFVRAIQRGAQIELLIATAGSEFVRDIEEVESLHRTGQISLEIKQIETLLREYVEDAVETMPKNITPKVFLGYFTTHLRSSITICDDTWAMLTLNLPPKRSVETTSFELENRKDGLLNDVIAHFNKAWSLSVKNNRVTRITS